MNSISIAEIKRGGMDALGAALRRGPAVIMKRNRAAAVVLTPEAYERLVASAQQSTHIGTALDWLLQTPALDQPDADAEAAAPRNSGPTAEWPER
jgi:hypothetical protein